MAKRQVAKRENREVKKPKSQTSKELSHPPNVRVTPGSAEQRDYLKAIQDHDITICTGVAGTGKTFLAVAAALQMLQDRDSSIERVAIARPIVEAGEKLGYLPGDLAHKADPYLRPILDALNDLLPSHCVDGMRKHGMLEVAPLAYMRGRTFKKTFMILDESQNASLKQLVMLVTRLGRGSKIVLTGDSSQTDIGNSGLDSLINILGKVPGIATIKMTSVSNQRHQLVKDIVDALAAAGITPQ